MNKKITIILILIFISISLSAKKLEVYNLFEITYIGLNIGDTLLTWDILKDSNYYEAGPIMKYIIKNKPLTILVTGAMTYLLLKISRHYFKKSKFWGYVGIIAMNLVMGYAVYHNYKIYRNIN